MIRKIVGYLLFAISFGAFAGSNEGMSPCDFEYVINPTHVRCPGGASGTATIVFLDGTAADYTIEWFNGSTTTGVSNLSAGTYFVRIVRNQTGCAVNTFVTILEPEPFSTEITKQDVQCYNNRDGEAYLTVEGGTRLTGANNYFYSWAPEGSTDRDLIGAGAGWHYVTVTDQNNCTTTDSIELRQPPELEYTYQVEDVKCFGDENGSINLTVFGGTPVYSYAWSSGETQQDIFQKPSGTFNVTITDDNGCQREAAIFIDSPEPISVDFDVTDATCFGVSDGVIDLSVFGGTVPFQFVWSDEDKVLGRDTEDLDEVAVGKYTVQITDQNDCYFTDSTEVRESNALVTFTEIEDAICYDSSNAAVDLFVSGGTEPYAYLWNNQSTDQDLRNIPAGDYSVTVADAKGCIATAFAEVGQPTQLSFGMTVEEVSCKDNDDGAVLLSPSGATPPYRYQWSNGETDRDVIDVVGGNYDVTVTDDNGCPFPATATVPVNERECITEMTVPTAFSPNDDGINDTWVIRNYELYPGIKVEVINRWGERIFRSDGYKENWDGTRNGQSVPSGTYYYVIDLGNGDSPFSGSLSVLR